VLLAVLALPAFSAVPPMARAMDAPTTLAVGAGVQRLPRWTGATRQRQAPLPYLDVEWPNHFSLSTLDGLHLDVIGGKVLHGGAYGDYQWGRESDDLGPLRGRVASLSPRLTLGGYLEWQLNKDVDVGSDLSHDLGGAGAYWRLYVDVDLPTPGLVQHSFELSWQAMNRSAMQRFFGISPAQAVPLGTPAWTPAAGQELAMLQYQIFVPTSQHTGLAAAIGWGRLLGDAAHSPLVTRYGSRNQVSESLAFIYHL
jgi:outer membrane scaffolding protein for murein synthesis (MipA/OmpV family)